MILKVPKQMGQAWYLLGSSVVRRSQKVHCFKRTFLGNWANEETSKEEAKLITSKRNEETEKEGSWKANFLQRTLSSMMLGEKMKERESGIKSKRAIELSKLKLLLLLFKFKISSNLVDKIFSFSINELMK